MDLRRTDVIGTLAKKAWKEDFTVYMMTPTKTLAIGRSSYFSATSRHYGKWMSMWWDQSKSVKSGTSKMWIKCGHMLDMMRRCRWITFRKSRIGQKTAGKAPQGNMAPVPRNSSKHCRPQRESRRKNVWKTLPNKESYLRNWPRLNSTCNWFYTWWLKIWRNRRGKNYGTIFTELEFRKH